MTGTPPAREKRWVILADDGRHVTLGRHTDPTSEEIDAAAEGLDKIGVGGWRAVLEGVYYSRGTVSLLMVREVAAPRAEWDTAVALFKRIRAPLTRAPAR